MGALEVLADGGGEGGRLERDGCICGAAWPDLLPGSSLQLLIDDHSIAEKGGSGKKIARGWWRIRFHEPAKNRHLSAACYGATIR
jgi:hypothetical protein